MAEIAYSTVMDVTSSWDRLKQVKDYELRAGDLLFERLFELEPSARAIFNFSKDENITASNPKFAVHAKAMVDMIDCAVAMLGPDLEPLEHELLRLGRRHLAYGVDARLLPVMEKSVIYAMEELLEAKFTRSDRKAWQTVFHFMIGRMTEGMGA